MRVTHFLLEIEVEGDDGRVYKLKNTGKDMESPDELMDIALKTMTACRLFNAQSGAPTKKCGCGQSE